MIKKLVFFPALFFLLTFIVSCDNMAELEKEYSDNNSVPGLKLSDDSDLNINEIAFRIDIIPPSDISSLSDYYLYWADSNGNKLTLIKQFAVNSNQLYHIFPENTPLNTNYKLILVYSVDKSGKKSKPFKKSVNDLYGNYSAPDLTVTSDTDLTKNQICMNLELIEPDNTLNLTKYYIFWSDSEGNLGNKIAEYSANGSNFSYTFSENTPVPSNAVKFAVYSENNDGFKSDYIYKDINDSFDNISIPQLKLKPDTDFDENEISIKLELIPPSNTTDVVSYHVYFADINGNTIGSEIKSFNEQPAQTFEHTIPENTSVPENAEKLISYSINCDNIQSDKFDINLEDIVIKKVSDLYIGRDWKGESSDYIPSRVMTVCNGKLYFNASADEEDDDDSNNIGYELYEYDGTNPPSLTKDIYSGSTGSLPSELATFNNKVYFQAESANGKGIELYSYNPSDNTVELTANIYTDSSYTNNSKPSHLYVYNNSLFFNAKGNLFGNEIYKLDTDNSLTRITGSECNSPAYFFEFENLLYFKAEYNSDTEIWHYNSQDGVLQFFNINNAVSSNPSYLHVFNGKLYFSADDGVNGNELWIHHGGDNAPEECFDINPGVSDSNPSFMTVYNNRLYFQADASPERKEIWCYDGTNSPYLFADILDSKGSGSEPAHFTEFNGKLYFTAKTGERDNIYNYVRKLFVMYIK